LLYSFTVLSQSSAAHHDLHSFPTRRSSDLHLLFARANGTEQSADPGCRLKPAAGGQKRQVTGTERRPREDHLQLEKASFQPVQRSEEHTSELQSRENLVCRLLLEKKKE